MNKKSYLVEGAELQCICGSKCSYLEIPAGHGYTAEGKKKANCKDCKAGVNIKDFGTCKRNKKGKVCKGYMKLSPKWENTGGFSWKLEKLNGETALTMDSILLCKKGGFIVPKTSGQGMVSRLDWNAYIQRYVGLMLATIGKMLCCLFGFDPINLNTGNFIYEKEDLIINGITKLSFHIFYNSLEEYRGGSLGEGWHHNYEISVERKEEGLLLLHLGDGREVPFHRSIGDVYAPVLGDTGLLKKEAEGYRYVSGEGTAYTFDEAGLLLTRKDRNGNTDCFFHNEAGQLTEARGANGGSLYYFYNREGNLYRVCDHTGREVQLFYSYRVLLKYVNPSGQPYAFGYNANLRLESVTTPRGIEGVKNVYDGANRVVKQYTPDGGMVELCYDDTGMRTYVKDQKGHITSHESDEKFRNIRTIYKDSEERFAYNERNQRTLYVDRNGNKTSYHYDEKGNLTGITDALGRERNFTYDNEGRLLSAAMEGKTVLRNTYDRNGHMVSSADALGRKRETVYDEKGLPGQLILPDGSSITLTHDERGNIKSVTDAYGITLSYTYDALNRVSSTTDGEGNRVSYQYDERDHLLSVTNQEGKKRSYVYNESGKPVQVEDFDGGIFRIAYNAMGKPEKLTDKEGRETARSYDPCGNVEKETAPSGAVTAYRYDRDNRLVQVSLFPTKKEEEEAARVVDYAYDPAGNLLKAEAGDGKEVLSQTSYEYDALNRITAVTDPAGGKTVYTYDRMTGKVSSITDQTGNVRTFHYNSAGELTEETDIHGNTTRYEYNALGQVTSVTDGAGRTTLHTYQPGGRRESTRYPDGRQRYYAYDSLGRISRKTDKNGYSISYTYDCMGRAVRITGSTGQEKTYAYDAMGNVTAMTDADGSTTRYAYTLSGKLKEVTDALGNRTEYVYDESDRLIHICQHGEAGEADRTTTYERDVFGQVLCVRDALGGEEHYRYDALGRMTEKRDREGYVTAYTYTPDGKPETVTYGDGSRVEMQYTPLRQLALINDWLGETRIERNREGKPLRITDHAGKTVSYEWGELGERRGMTYPDGTKVSWHYDDLLRPAELRREAVGKDALSIRYRYDEEGRPAGKENSGGFRTGWSYNQQGQPETLTHTDRNGILDCYRYGYDAMGNRTSITKERRGLPEESGSYRYTYDALQRLTGVEKDGKPLRSYSYDSFGNRTGREDYKTGRRSASSYDALNRMVEEEIWEEWKTEAGGMESDSPMPEPDVRKSFLYDKRGNLTGEYENGSLLHGYIFHAMNRLAKAWNGEGKEAAYLYNGLGQRTGRVTDGKREDYVLDLTKPYHNLLSIEGDERKQNFYWDFGVTAMEEEGRKPRCYLQDELGSPLRVLYGNGNGDTYGYDEFGQDLYDPEKENPLFKRYTRQGEGQPFGYTGYRYDDISGTCFAQAREYRPESGRFTAEDVIRGNGAVPKTLNRYGYCLGNPLGYIDLDGLRPAWLDGIFAHLQFEGEFMADYYYEEGVYEGMLADDDYYGSINVGIKGGGVKGGMGFADVVLHDNGVANIYEIKPQSYYEDTKKRESGEKQLKNYVGKYMKEGEIAIRGDSRNIDPLLYIETPFVFDTNRTIIYRMYEDSLGMIYYEFRESGDKKRVTLPATQKDKNKEFEAFISMVIQLSALAGIKTVEAVENRIFPFMIIDKDILELILEEIMDRFSGGGGGCMA